MDEKPKTSDEPKETAKRDHRWRALDEDDQHEKKPGKKDGFSDLLTKSDAPPPWMGGG